MKTTPISLAVLPASSILACFRELPDPRVDRTRDHELGDILVIGLCALLCGGENFADMERFGQAQEGWLRTFLRLPCGIPSHDTFNRVFSALDPKTFQDCFLRWTQSVRQAISEEIVALDGKALRRALKTKAVPYIVNAWAADNGLVLGQVKVDEKSNEITAVPELLRALELTGCIVTLDAMGCQKKIAREIREADADYVLALKGNQETVHEEVKAFLDDAVQRIPSPSPPLTQRKRITAASNCVAIGRQTGWAGSRISRNGKALPPSGWSRPSGGYRERKFRSSAATSFPASRSSPSALPAPCAVTGPSRTTFTGCSMCTSAKTRTAPARAMPTKTWRSCVGSLSTCSSVTPFETAA